MSNYPAVSVHLVIHNGDSWVRSILDPLMEQTWPNMRIFLLDAASDDDTASIVKTEYPRVQYIRSPENVGIWRGNQDVLMDKDNAPYVLILPDVILDRHFIERGVRALESDPRAGAVQAKIYRADRKEDGTFERTNIIDTVGFQINRAHHITNKGHGEPDHGQFDTLSAVFGVEGAAPLFRRSALEACRVDGALIDPDYRVQGIGYGDDADLAWRMQLFGFRHLFVPDMVGWHDRSTTKTLAGSLMGHRTRIRSRRAIPLLKRRLDWSNIRFTIIKNTPIGDLVRYAPWIAAREMAVLAYTVLFEPGVLREGLRFFRLLPVMLRRRKKVQSNIVLARTARRRWFSQ
jgi:GT2 family glycosyltransferase